MKVLLAQLGVASHDPRANADRAAGVLRQHPEAELAVFPELCLSGYTTSSVYELGRACAAALPRVCEAAAETATAVAIGFVEKIDDGVANAVALIDARGRLVGSYRKRQLFGAEQDVFLPGEALLIARLAGRRVAPLVCFDVEFPELARAVAKAGADLLVVLSANMEPFYADHELLTRARALENHVPLVYVNAVGTAEGHVFVGGSRVVDIDGRTRIELRGADEAVAVAEVAAVPRLAHDRVDYLRHLLPTPPVAFNKERPLDE